MFQICITAERVCPTLYLRIEKKRSTQTNRPHCETDCSAQGHRRRFYHEGNCNQNEHIDQNRRISSGKSLQHFQSLWLRSAGSNRHRLWALLALYGLHGGGGTAALGGFQSSACGAACVESSGLWHREFLQRLLRSRLRPIHKQTQRGQQHEYDCHTTG